MPSPRLWYAERTTERVQLIDGVTRDYNWGSTTSIPELIGLPITGTPVAELWLGAHPSAPSLVGCHHVPLDQVVAADPDGTLGSAIANRFGSLPFLLKVLAAAEPLSLQAHPTTSQAQEGYDREEAAGIPVDAPNRLFRDRSHKPELICALTAFDALCGFRDPSASRELFAMIPTAALDPVDRMLRDDPSPEGLRRLLESLLTLDPGGAAALVDPVVVACDENRDGQFRAERAMAAALGRRYPGDAGVVIALLLNLVTLQPGEALFLDAGNLHAYLRGTGVEIMANSDNVLRGGLTSKHIDVAALVDIVDATPITPEIQRPSLIDGVARYAVPVPEFSLQRIELSGRHVVAPGPAILLCTAGHAEAGGHVLEKGSAAWIPADEAAIPLEGTATIFRASVGPVR
jgi:mannose-6-phosphate isomerase